MFQHKLPRSGPGQYFQKNMPAKTEMAVSSKIGFLYCFCQNTKGFKVKTHLRNLKKSHKVTICLFYTNTIRYVLY